MRKFAIAAIAALMTIASANAVATGGLRVVTHESASDDSGLVQGSSTSAGTVSGATTVGTGSADTYGIATGSASSTGKDKSDDTYAKVQGTTDASGHTESGTLVLGAGAAGSIAGAESGAYVAGQANFSQGTHQHLCYYSRCGPRFNEQTDLSGNAGIIAGTSGEAYSGTGSIGTGGGLSVNGYVGYGDARAVADVDYLGRGEYGTSSDVDTASGASTYTLELGNAIGNTHVIGGGAGIADAFVVQ